MKNLEKFAKNEIPKEILKFLKGGSCQDLLNCHLTAERDNPWLADECDRVLGPTCNHY